MPTYAYACSACEHAFDVRQSFSDAPLTTCPRCERETLRKLFSPVGVVFKGSGFYRNDSRAAAKSKAAGAGGSGTSEADGKPASGRDSAAASGADGATTPKTETASPATGAGGPAAAAAGA